jgi:glutamine amidotransferase
MCRLVGYAGPPLPVGHLVFGGRHSLYRQSYAPRELLSGSVNADGWGVVWYPEAERGRPSERGPVRIARAEPIWYDPDLRRLLDAAEAPVALAALRNATPGLPVDGPGLLPLVHGSWAFVLNGWIPRFRSHHMRALRASLPDELYAALAGVSDAETLFLLAVARLDDGAGPLEALEEVAGRVAERLEPGEEARLTLVLSSPEGIWALHGATGDTTCNSLYLSLDGGPSGEGVLLASEVLDDGGSWRPVPAHGRVTLSRAGMRIEAGRPL